MAQPEKLRSSAEPLLAEVGLELWDVEIGGDVVRILVDRPGGVDLDALSEASRALSGLLDDREDLAPDGQYQLEISSPGLERTLRVPEHYRRYVGTDIKVKTSAPVAGGRRHQGVLASVDDSGFVLRGATDGPVRIAWDQVERARTVFEWGPAPKPGRPRTAAQAARTPRPEGQGQPVMKDSQS